MRIIDFCMFIMCLNLGVSFVGTMMSGDMYLKQSTSLTINTTQNASLANYIVGTGDASDATTATNNMISQQQKTDYNPLSASVDAFISGTVFLISFIGNTVFLFNILINVFHLPLVIVAPLQTMIWVTMGLGIAQWRAGRSAEGIQ